MANYQMFILLFALLVSSVVTAQKKDSRAKRSFGLCDYNKEAGFKCSGCHERHICLPFNIGLTKPCGILLPYCNKGFCTKTMGPMCNDSTEDTEKTSNAASTTSSSASEAATACTSESSKN